MKITGSTLLLLAFLGACSGPAPEAAVPAQSSIVYSSNPIALVDANRIECEGPADELAMLGAVCGRTILNAQTGALRDVEWGNKLEIGDFYFYAMGSTTDLPGLGYAAGIVTLEGPEAVIEGRVNATFATENACSRTFAGTAEFLWRNTTIRLQLLGEIPC